MTYVARPTNQVEFTHAPPPALSLRGASGLCALQEGERVPLTYGTFHLMKSSFQLAGTTEETAGRMVALE